MEDENPICIRKCYNVFNVESITEGLTVVTLKNTAVNVKLYTGVEVSAQACFSSNLSHRCLYDTNVKLKVSGDHNLKVFGAYSIK